MCVLSSNDGGIHAGELDTNPGIFEINSLGSRLVFIFCKARAIMIAKSKKISPVSATSNPRITRGIAWKKTNDPVLLTILDLDTTDTLIQGLSREDCHSIDDILSLQDGDIDMLGYENGGNVIPVFRSRRNFIKALTSWNYTLQVYGWKKFD